MRRWMPLLTVVLVLLACAFAEGCPFCKDSIPNSDAQSTGGVPSGFNNTIFLMLGAVFSVLGFVAFTLIKGARSVQPRHGFPIK